MKQKIFYILSCFNIRKINLFIETYIYRTDPLPVHFYNEIQTFYVLFPQPEFGIPPANFIQLGIRKRSNSPKVIPLGRNFPFFLNLSQAIFQYYKKKCCHKRVEKGGGQFDLYTRLAIYQSAFYEKNRILFASVSFFQGGGINPLPLSV